jgi:hypothetical protein
MEVSGQVHAPAALSPGEKASDERKQIMIYNIWSYQNDWNPANSNEET